MLKPIRLPAREVEFQKGAQKENKQHGWKITKNGLRDQHTTRADPEQKHTFRPRRVVEIENSRAETRRATRGAWRACLKVFMVIRKRGLLFLREL